MVHKRNELFVNGEWVVPEGDSSTIEVVHPVTEETVGSYPVASAHDVDRAVRAARTAFDSGVWSGLSVEQRAEHLHRFAEQLERRSADIREIVMAETGILAGQADFESGTLADLLRRNAGFALDVQKAEESTTAAGTPLQVQHLPVGVVAAMPAWNASQNMAGSKIGPALAAGCTVVLKPSEQTSLNAFIIADAAEAAGLPPGVFNLVTGDAETSAALVSHPGVDKVSFTGSTVVGKKVAVAAAQNLTRVNLELGGKSAAIVLDDAPIDTVVQSMLQGVIMISGQMCVALSRLLVSRTRHDEVVDALKVAFEKVVIGDPADETTEMGPLVTREHRERVMNHVRTSVEEGARLVTGGGVPEGLDRGWFMQPTILDDVSNTSHAAREEFFGPVTSVITYDDLDEAIALANSSEFGLAGAVFSADFDAARDTANRLLTGSVLINEGMRWEPDVPTGGIRASGIGREGGVEGLRSFCETQVVFLTDTQNASMEGSEHG